MFAMTLRGSMALLGCLLGGPIAAEFEWVGKQHVLENPPESLAPGALRALEFWQPFAERHAYRLILVDDQRIVLLLPDREASATKTVRLVERALARADALLPAPKERRTEPSAPGLPGFSPEDLFGDRWQGKRTTDEAPARPRWGDAETALDSETGVLGQFRSMEEYAAALDLLGESFPYLGGWLAEGKDSVGCVLEQPLFAACLESAPGLEEWSLDNELVHRSAQLIVLRRFQQLPPWLTQGIAWNVEFDLLKGIYCFPWRSEFVSAGEHDSWERELRERFSGRRAELLKAADLTACRRGAFDRGGAIAAFGAVRHLARSSPHALSACAEDLRFLHRKLGREAAPRGGAVPSDFRLSDEVQRQTLEEHFGAEVWKWLTEQLRRR